MPKLVGNQRCYVTPMEDDRHVSLAIVAVIKAGHSIDTVVTARAICYTLATRAVIYGCCELLILRAAGSQTRDQCRLHKFLVRLIARSLQNRSYTSQKRERNQQRLDFCCRIPPQGSDKGDC